MCRVLEQKVEQTYSNVNVSRNISTLPCHSTNLHSIGHDLRGQWLVSRMAHDANFCPSSRGAGRRRKLCIAEMFSANARVCCGFLYMDCFYYHHGISFHPKAFLQNTRCHLQISLLRSHVTWVLVLPGSLCAHTVFQRRLCRLFYGPPSW